MIETPDSKLKLIRRLITAISLAGLIFTVYFMMNQASPLIQFLGMTAWISSPYFMGLALLSLVPEKNLEFNFASLASVICAFGLLMLFWYYQQNEPEPILGFGLLITPLYSFVTLIGTFSLIFFWRRRKLFKIK